MNVLKQSFMKKLTALLLSVLMLFALPSCNDDATDVTTPEATITEAPAPQDQPPVVEMLPTQEVLVLSQNVLNGNAESIAQRAPTMIEYFLETNADSIGVQECVANWANALDEGLKDRYARVGVECGSGKDKGSFATYVYYRKDKYRVIATDTFWMSETPDIPSQYNSKTTMNRTCTWVILENIETGFRYVHINCHLDWEDETANVVQTQMIRNAVIRFAEMGYPVFATGDFNTSEGSVSYRQMLASNLVADSKFVAEKSDGTTSASSYTVDYCFVTDAFITVSEYDVIPNVHGDVEVSDHKGIFVRATVKALPKQDHSSTVPQFAADAEITVEGYGHLGRTVTVSFPQATDVNGHTAKKYEIVLKSANGNTLSKSVATANSYRSLPALSMTAQVSGGVAKGNYRLEITPISLFGEKGRMVCFDLDWTEENPDTVKQPDAADILDVSVQNGVAIDNSPNQYALTKVGAVTVTKDAMVFDKQGTVRTSNIFSEYIKMADGFTMEAIITTGEDITTAQNYVSNLHAGGFAFSCDRGKIVFTLHNGLEYVYTSTEIKANTTYHVVGIFDGVNVYLYLNGVRVVSNTMGGSFGIPTDDNARHLCIGADSTPDGQGQAHADVTVYKVAIYSDAVTPGEVAYLYQHQ